MILLDTHVVLWLSYDYDRISARAHAAIAEARAKGANLAISDITFLEIARLWSYGRVQLTPDPETFLADVEKHFTVLPITANIARQAYDLPPSFPKDPVDRVIGATALIEDIPLITADDAIKRSRSIPLIW